MQDWWTYRLSDFLLFSPRTYYRMLEQHNQAIWPAQLAALALGVAMLRLLRKTGLRQGRVISGILGLLWVWVAWAFLWRKYAAINWAAAYIAPAFVLEGLMLLWWGVLRSQLGFRFTRSTGGLIGGGLAVVGLLLYPLLAPLAGRPLQQSEMFGLFPDPTAVASVGLLLLTASRLRWALLIIPLMWTVIAGLTMWALRAQP